MINIHKGICITDLYIMCGNLNPNDHFTVYHTYAGYGGYDADPIYSGNYDDMPYDIAVSKVVRFTLAGTTIRVQIEVVRDDV